LRIAKLGAVLSLALMIGLATPSAGWADGSPSGTAGSECIGHSLSVIATPDLTIVDTRINNKCEDPVTLSIGYLIEGPCPHAKTVTVTLEPGGWDVTLFYPGLCSGHYTALQRLRTDVSRIGRDIMEFDSPPS
jgi:hypothetical protein